MFGKLNLTGSKESLARITEYLVRRVAQTIGGLPRAVNGSGGAVVRGTVVEQEAGDPRTFILAGDGGFDGSIGIAYFGCAAEGTTWVQSSGTARVLIVNDQLNIANGDCLYVDVANPGGATNVQPGTANPIGKVVDASPFNAVPSEGYVVALLNCPVCNTVVA